MRTDNFIDFYSKYMEPERYHCAQNYLNLKL